MSWPSNELLIQNPEQRIHAIKKLVGELGGRCRFLDSTRLYPDMPRVRDHIHPTMNARHEWAKRVVKWLAEQRVPNGDKPWELKPRPADPLPLADAPPKKK